MLTLQDKYELAVECLQAIAKHYEADWTADGYWETGNYDDTFAMGVKEGEINMASMAKLALLSIGENK